jgi:hypothetical protein
MHTHARTVQYMRVMQTHTSIHVHTHDTYTHAHVHTYTYMHTYIHTYIQLEDELKELKGVKKNEDETAQKRCSPPGSGLNKYVACILV